MAWGFNNDKMGGKIRDQVDKVRESLKGTFGANTGNRPNGSTLGLTTGTTMKGNTASGPSGGRADTYSTVNSRGQSSGSNTDAGSSSNGRGQSSPGGSGRGGAGYNDKNDVGPSRYRKGGLVKKRGWGQARTFKK